MKVVINRCFGGFVLSDAAYLKLHEWGVPIQKYIKQERDPVTGLYPRQSVNDGEVIFDRELTPADESSLSAIYHKFKGVRGNNRYWDDWTRDNRTHPLVVRVVDELGAAADGDCSELAVVTIPDGIEWDIDEYDGREKIAEKHREWA